MRAYYACDTAAFDTLAPGDVIVLHRDDEQVILLSPDDPHLALETIGAQRLGTRISDLDGPVAELITCAHVRRIVNDEPVELVIPMIAIEAEDEELDSLIPSVIFAGDAIEDYR